MKNLLRGSFWLTVGNVVSRIMGILYLVPWLILLGTHGNQAQALFNIAYTPYALFLSLATAGFPSAIAKYTAQYRAQHDTENEETIFGYSILIMFFSGLISGLLLYLLAPAIAQLSPAANSAQSTIAIRVLVPAIIIIPAQGIMRGRLQGKLDLKYVGISQLVEQFIRIIFILFMTLYFIKFTNNVYTTAVYFSIFAAFVGAAISMLYLYYSDDMITVKFVLKFSKRMICSLRYSGNMFLLIMKSSMPFILVGSIVTITQIIDQIFFKQMLIWRGISDIQIENMYVVFSANPTKLTAAIIALAVAISNTSFATLASVKSRGKAVIKTNIENNFKLLFYSLIPTVAIIACLSGYIYNVFFLPAKMGGIFLALNTIQSLFIGLFMNNTSILMSLNRSYKAIKLTMIALIIKVALQVPLVYLWSGVGAIIATGIAFVFADVVSFVWIRRLYAVNFNKKYIGILNIAVKIALLLIIVVFFLQANVHIESRLESLLIVCGMSLASILLYVNCTDRMGISKYVFGMKINPKYRKYRHLR